MGSFLLAPYLAGVGVPREEDIGIILLVDLGTYTFCSMVDLDGTCRADREDNPFVGFIIFLHGTHG